MEPPLKNLKKHATCSICLDTFTDPKKITGLHTFFCECLKKFRCPECQAEVSLPEAKRFDKLPTSFHHNSLLGLLAVRRSGDEIEICCICKSSEISYCFELMAKINTATRKFEAEHDECVRVLPYLKGTEVVVRFYVFSGESGIPKHLHEAAKKCFGEMEVKLEWSDLYSDAANILKVTPLEYPSGEPNRLDASQVDEISEIINKNLCELDKHRNVTSVQASFKITMSKQTDIPCITVYVLGKGFIPVGESELPKQIGPYPVDVVDGFWFRTEDLWYPREEQKQSKVLGLGASIGIQGEEASGTLGAIVEDGGTFYALSCDHVMRHPTKKEIIHPGLNDHLNYLRYHLNEYKNCIKGIIERDSEEEGINKNELDVNSLNESNKLLKKFEELKSIKERHANSGRCTQLKLDEMEVVEKAFEEGFNQPRVIGEHTKGISKNVEWTDRKEYFIDVAIAKLTPEEVNSLREHETVEMIGRKVNWGDNVECSPTTTTAIMNAGKLLKNGRTTGYTTSDRVVNVSVDPPQFMKDTRKFRENPPLHDIKMDTYYICDSCKRVQRHPCCECCQARAKSENLWCKNCLCIASGTKDFCDVGDSGAVIFELKEEPERTLGFGVIFAVHEGGYHRYAIASPLQVALNTLSKEILEQSNLRLVSNFDSLP